MDICLRNIVLNNILVALKEHHSKTIRARRTVIVKGENCNFYLIQRRKNNKKGIHVIINQFGNGTFHQGEILQNKNIRSKNILEIVHSVGSYLGRLHKSFFSMLENRNKLKRILNFSNTMEECCILVSLKMPLNPKFSFQKHSSISNAREILS